MNKNFSKAIEVLKNGGIVIFPTDTAFGIGCRIDNERAIRKLFKTRRRPREKAVPILVSSIAMAQDYVEPITPEARKIMQKYWPGGLSLILRCIRERVPSLVRGGGETIGVRFPDHDSIIRVIRAVGVPILGPSANFAGGKTPFYTSELDPKLVNQVDFVLPGRCKIKRPSTVLDVSKKPWRILRQGAIRLENGG